MSNKANYYFNADDFRKELAQSYSQGFATEQAAHMIIDLINHIFSKKSWHWETFPQSAKEDAYDEVLFACLKAINNKMFDINSKSSPFSYFTRTIINRTMNARSKYQNRCKREFKFAISQDPTLLERYELLQSNPTIVDEEDEDYD